MDKNEIMTRIGYLKHIKNKEDYNEEIEEILKDIVDKVYKDG